MYHSHNLEQNTHRVSLCRHCRHLTCIYAVRSCMCAFVCVHLPYVCIYTGTWATTASAHWSRTPSATWLNWPRCKLPSMPYIMCVCVYIYKVKNHLVNHRFLPRTLIRHPIFSPSSVFIFSCFFSPYFLSAFLSPFSFCHSHFLYFSLCLNLFKLNSLFDSLVLLFYLTYKLLFWEGVAFRLSTLCITWVLHQLTGLVCIQGTLLALYSLATTKFCC